ncbi:MAG TPA: hypothetical protein VE684_06100 [Crenalkalicoccus sp.]|jgi:hypothetical protein|nr:hypothetical protein [Crenalkalicoccus sp.]
MIALRTSLIAGALGLAALAVTPAAGHADGYYRGAYPHYWRGYGYGYHYYRPYAYYPRRYYYAPRAYYAPTPYYGYYPPGYYAPGFGFGAVIR